MTTAVPFADEARTWIAQDPDDTTRAELEAVVAAAESGAADAAADLESRFSARLEFGTAGLRGEIGAGPNRMNRVLVSQAAAGFAAYLLERAELEGNSCLETCYLHTLKQKYSGKPMRGK